MGRSKEDLCTTLLGKVPNKFNDGWISMNWLAKKFDKLPMDTIEVLIRDILMPDKSRNLVHIMSPLHLVYFKMRKTELGISYVSHIISRAVLGHEIE
ncbi:serine/threonine-protein phosphatase 7 long form-like protein [Gossypium australe]|uniref:Serine/threonine-protein phosphatase 7 long form-like protein n=1 Tax=Gossypium australe TaxID=47621 RepID=A0A5B6UFC1_9ROSI|nr:serine/threonine-protein phosphatase 7 long form-like protein [Gossypium australe]